MNSASQMLRCKNGILSRDPSFSRATLHYVVSDQDSQEQHFSARPLTSLGRGLQQVQSAAEARLVVSDQGEGLSVGIQAVELPPE